MELRAPVPDEAPAVLEVLVARDIADLGAPDCTLGDVLDEWGLADFELAADARVAEVDGRIVAYGSVRREGTFAVVAPEFEGRGIGTRLLRWAEGREAERPGGRSRQWVAGANERAAELLRGAGYELVRSYWRMDRPLDESVVAGEPPAGVRVRSLDVDGDAATLHELDALSFAGAPDFHPMSLQAFRDEHLGAHDLAPELSAVAELGGGVVGFALARNWKHEGVGFIDVLGVHPDHRRVGIASTLLRSAFAGFAAAGLARAQLGVASDNPSARRLYERVGMTPRLRFDTYERPRP
ncbi:MAG TPA: GNAT family N-acetyltransferase [Solirubrobacteraceae bacterium]|jgi:mycothiol synthase|nr:GNAT family N-acetyltransferase [Solirubrobacteraceae bacterium]